MKKLPVLLAAVCASLQARARNPPITGTDIVKSVYQNRSLRATNSIWLQPGFSVSSGGFEARVAPDPATHGSWSDPLPWVLPDENETFVGVHTHVLPNGKVLSWQGHNDDDRGHLGAHVAVWEPIAGTFRQFDNDVTDIFCSGHTFTSNGNLFVAGGHWGDHNYSADGITPGPFPSNILVDPTTGRPNDGFIGLRDADTFDWLATTTPSGAPWVQLPDMTDRRWYPTVTTLSNGKLLVIAGQRFGGISSVLPEV